MTVLVVFDIEAVPDFETARRLLAQPDSTPDAEIRRMLGERYSRDSEGPTTTFLKAPIYRVVSIATLNAKREDGGGPWTVTQIGSRSVGEKTEAEVLLGFVKALPVDSRGTGPILVTFGGNGFDLPLLRYRAFALGVPVPSLHGGAHRNYWHRFGQGGRASVSLIDPRRRLRLPRRRLRAILHKARLVFCTRCGSGSVDRHAPRLLWPRPPSCGSLALPLDGRLRRAERAKSGRAWCVPFVPLHSFTTFPSQPSQAPPPPR
jgi:hypothetical protein